jgi:hypothetical protein
MTSKWLPPVERLTAFTVIALLGLAIVSEVQSSPPVAVDEPGWITSGYLTWRLAITGASPQGWVDAYEEAKLGPFGNQNPPVGKLMIGAAVAAGKSPADPVRYTWRWPYGYQDNLRAGNLPPPGLLKTVRYEIALLAIASLLLAYLVARQVVGGTRWAPIMAPVMLFVSVPFHYHATRVYTDLPQLFLSLLAVWLFQRWLCDRRVWALAGTLVTLGLACATKFSAGSLVLATAAFCACLSASRQRRALYLLCIAIVPAAVFVAVNPYLWGDPIRRTLLAWRTWSTFLSEQRLDPTLAAFKINGPLHALKLVSLRTLLIPVCGFEVPILDHLWLYLLDTLLAGVSVASLTLAALQRCSRGPVARSKLLVTLALGVFASAISWYAPGGMALLGAMFVAGTWRLSGQLRHGGWRTATGYFAVVLAVTFTSSVLWLPFDWSRYYLPVLALTPVLGAAGAAEIETAIKIRVWGRRTQSFA